MRIVLKSKNVSLTPAIKKYLEDKLIHPAEKLLKTSSDDDATILELELGRTTRHHRKGEVWRAEANLTFGKTLLRAEHDGESPHEVIDVVGAELSREIKAFKAKNKTKEIRGARTLKRMVRRGKKPL